MADLISMLFAYLLFLSLSALIALAIGFGIGFGVAKIQKKDPAKMPVAVHIKTRGHTNEIE